MQELIRITTDSNGRQVLSARDVYKGLELSMAHWSKWSKKNIIDNEFMAEGQDWEGFTLKVNGNEVQDFAITIDFAKRIIAKSGTQNGEIYLTQLIEAEKKYRESLQGPVMPANYIEALRALLSSEEEKLVLQYELSEAQPKVEFYDTVAKSDDAVSVGDAARVLNIGQNKLFKFLRDNGILKPTANVPYQRYLTLGWFKVIEQNYIQNGETRINFKTLVYQKGLQGIAKLIAK